MISTHYDAQSTIQSVLDNPRVKNRLPENAQHNPSSTLAETWPDLTECNAIIEHLNLIASLDTEGNEDSLLLWETPPLYKPDAGGRPYLDLYLLDHQAPVVVVVPGGGYTMVAHMHEGKDIAEAYNAAGFHALMLRYRTTPNFYPAPQMDLIRAIKIVRAHANEWKIISDQLVVCGFSAGGHLTASIGGLHDEIKLPGDEFEHISAKPNALVLSYAVLSFKTWAHQGSVNSLLGENNTREMREKLSCEKMVTSDYPPSFIWTCENDTGVPIQNSMMMAEACSAMGVPNELHIYPGGSHGVGLGHGIKAEAWFDQSVTFLKKVLSIH
jgi:acetyl esterase/lipase